MADAFQCDACRQLAAGKPKVHLAMTPLAPFSPKTTIPTWRGDLCDDCSLGAQR